MKNLTEKYEAEYDSIKQETGYSLIGKKEWVLFRLNWDICVLDDAIASWSDEGKTKYPDRFNRITSKRGAMMDALITMLSI